VSYTQVAPILSELNTTTAATPISVCGQPFTALSTDLATGTLSPTASKRGKKSEKEKKSKAKKCKRGKENKKGKKRKAKKCKKSEVKISKKDKKAKPTKSKKDKRIKSTHTKGATKRTRNKKNHANHGMKKATYFTAQANHAEGDVASNNDSPLFVGVIASVAVVGMIVVAAVVHRYVRKNDKVELEVASTDTDQ